MPDKRKLEDIVPPKTGVKLKRKAPLQTPTEPKAPQVIPNIGKDVQQEHLPPPSEDATKIAARINIARQNLMKSMKDFNKLLTSSILPENRSGKDKDDERQIVVELTNAAQEIDQLSYGEGTLALSVFAVRQAIFFRDAGNRLAYEIEELKKRLAKFEPQEKEDEAKKKIMDFAKELGIKIRVGNE